MTPNIMLSICIPTFNRSSMLRQTIESIVVDHFFESGKVEIVVSDNASTDDTEAIMKYYCSKYQNIRYSKNQNNNGFMNIFTVLNMGRGELCKVVNDYTIFNKNTLEKLLLLVETNLEAKPQIFFGNGLLNSKKEEQCHVFDHFMSIISYWCTFVGGYCIWKKDFDLIKHNSVNEMFPHTSLLFLSKNKQNYLIDNNNLFTNLQLQNKGGYNLFNVFGVLFLNMLVTIKNDGFITDVTFRRIKKQLFYQFFILWYYNLFINKKIKFNFDKKDIKKNMTVYYSNLDYIILCILGRMYFLKSIKFKIHILFKKIFKKKIIWH